MIFSKSFFYENFLQESHQSVKQFDSRPGPIKVSRDTSMYIKAIKYAFCISHMILKIPLYHVQTPIRCIMEPETTI